MNFLKDFFINIIFIFSPLVAYPYIYKTQKQNTTIFRILIYLLFSLALMIAMTFPVNFNGLVYDFRSIPLVVGSLYGGPYVSVFLYLTLIVYRYMLGSSYDLIYACSILPTSIFVYFVLKRYTQFSLLQKVISGAIVCTLIKLMTFSIYLSIVNPSFIRDMTLFPTLKTFFLQALVIVVLIYLMELTQRYFHMHEEAIMGEKIKIISHMAASVAHEIRNPLTSVRGFIQLMGDQSVVSEKKGYYQKIALEELDRAQSIISDYLSLAKSDLENVEHIYLNDEMRYVVNVLSPYANYNGVTIELDSCEDELYIPGDKNKLRQALINIGKNAIEAMSVNGILKIKLYEKMKMPVISISDNGIGMTPEQIKLLGTPYFSTKEKGTGLGTMVAFNIIRGMNGKITIESKIGLGTTFELAFTSAS